MFFTDSSSVDELIQSWTWLFGEWFPASGFLPADGPCFEMCGDKMDGDIHVVDICVPVKPM